MSVANIKESLKHSCKNIYSACPSTLQNAILSGYGYLKSPLKYGSSFRQNLEFLSKSQWFSYDELCRLQSERLRRLVTHAYHHVPFYKQIFDDRGISPKDIKSSGDLCRLPLLTKSDIRTHFDDLISDTHSKLGGHLIGTSGTTGSPLQFYWDHRRESMETALLHRHLSWAGFDRGERKAVFRGLEIGNPRGPNPKYWRHNQAENELLFSSSHLSAHTAPAYLDELNRFQPSVIWGYPSSVYAFSQYLGGSTNNLSFSLKGIFLSSEPVYSWQKETIERTLGAQIFDWYGLSEGVISAGQCNHGNYHINIESGVIEVFPSEHSPGLLEIVATGLDNFMMPLIRYRTGDVVESVGGTCNCGRGLPIMGAVQTKSEDIIVTPDDRYISPSVLTFPFKSLTGVSKSQIVQNSISEIIIKLVATDKFTLRAEEDLVKDIHERIGHNMKVSVERVNDIHRTASGKYRWVISKVATAGRLSKEKFKDATLNLEK